MRRWLLLRGWTREAGHWGAFTGAMRTAFPNDAIEALDLPGAGRWHREASPPSIARIMERTRERARDLTLEAPFHVLGLSMGGMVAMEWARLHAQEVAALVLVNTSARPFCRLHDRLRLESVRELLSIAATRDARAKEAAIYRLTTNAGGAPDAMVDEWTRIRSDRHVSATNALRQLAAAARYRAPEGKPCERVLVLASEADRLVDARCSSTLARAWNAPLVMHRSAGHDLPLEDGPWVARETARWLAS